MEFQYKTKGTCSRLIEFDLNDDNTVTNIRFTGGCDGNLKGIAALCEGMDAEEIIDRVEGITCGRKSTSCPDQLATAITDALAQK